MCKDCTCKKIIDFSDMARQLLDEFGHIMPEHCIWFLDKVKNNNIILQKKTKPKSKYPLQ